VRDLKDLTLVNEYDCHVTDHKEDLLNREEIKHKFDEIDETYIGQTD
jgi:hypothetical protein